MTITEFIAKWRRVDLTERSASQQHFLDLCALVGQPPPAAADPTGTEFCFEKGASKAGGGEGWADVWKRGHFAWEYKGKLANLTTAYQQLLQYKDALDNPPLLVVSDMERFVIRTNFTNTPARRIEFKLDDLIDERNLAVLRAVFFDPDRLKPEKTTQRITEDAAERITQIATSLRERGVDAQHVARFLDRVVFCLFAEDVGLLPDQLFTRLVAKAHGDPTIFARLISGLFEAMAHGGEGTRHVAIALAQSAGVGEGRRAGVPGERRWIVGADGDEPKQGRNRHRALCSARAGRRQGRLGAQETDADESLQ
jgi:hypothetical protein